MVSSEPDLKGAAATMGDEESLRLLTQLVAAAPTNLIDRAHQRVDKANYLRAADVIVRAARAAGLSTRIYDPLVAGDIPGDWQGANRPNVIIDLDVGAKETVLILAHFDVVPVPAEQWPRWRTPPHSLSLRSDGRLYGRGAADDLGGGVVASLQAMRRLANGPTPSPRNVRLIACCDEETGGEGGVEAVKEHDGLRAPDDPERLLQGDVALIPDGSPLATAGSSGAGGLVGTFSAPVSLLDTLAYGSALVGLHEVARTWKSEYLSPDWPDRHAPEPVITGRATVTRFDLEGTVPDPAHIRLLAAHSENDAGNQIARVVTWVVGGPAAEVDTLRTRLSALVPAPYRLESAGAAALVIPPGAQAMQLVGESGHGGYPHRAHNPVPVTFTILRAAIDRGWLDGRATCTPRFVIDLRLPPEMEFKEGIDAALSYVRSWTAAHAPLARIESPPGGGRAGYALPLDHPALIKLEGILRDTLGVHGIRGEYGGTDASALRNLRTPTNQPMPALVFGVCDPESHIHEAEESVDPRKIAAVAASIERFVREP